jgi:hypothetical protein
MAGCVQTGLPRHQAESSRQRLRAVAEPHRPGDAPFWAEVEPAPSAWTAPEYDVVVFPPLEPSPAFVARVAPLVGLSAAERGPWPMVVRAGLTLGPARELAASLADPPATVVLRRNLPGRHPAPLVPWYANGTTYQAVLHAYPDGEEEFAVRAVADLCGLPVEQARAALESLPLTLAQGIGGQAMLCWGRFRGRADVRVSPSGGGGA